jgi:hypothetical protein
MGEAPASSLGAPTRFISSYSSASASIACCRSAETGEARVLDV